VIFTALGTEKASHDTRAGAGTRKYYISPMVRWIHATQPLLEADGLTFLSTTIAWLNNNLPL
jgi:hypothetical protein